MSFLPTNGFSIEPLKVKLLAGEQKVAEKSGWFPFDAHERGTLKTRRSGVPVKLLVGQCVHAKTSGSAVSRIRWCFAVLIGFSPSQLVWILAIQVSFLGQFGSNKSPGKAPKDVLQAKRGGHGAWGVGAYDIETRRFKCKS